MRLKRNSPFVTSGQRVAQAPPRERRDTVARGAPIEAADAGSGDGCVSTPE